MTAAQLRACILVILLAVCTAQDLEYRHVALPAAVSGIPAGIVITVVLRDLSRLSVAGGILIGFLLLAAALPTRGAVGTGDGLVLAQAGALIGAAGCLTLLVTALLLIMVWASLMFLFGRVRKTDSIPFVPFILAAYLLMLAAGAG